MNSSLACYRFRARSATSLSKSLCGRLSSSTRLFGGSRSCTLLGKRNENCCCLQQPTSRSRFGYQSCREIADYVVNKNNTRGTASQLETRSFLSRLERDGLNVQALLVDPMIYTYIDRDRSEQNEVSDRPCQPCACPIRTSLSSQ